MKSEKPAILVVEDEVLVRMMAVQVPGSMDGLKLAHAVRERWAPIELLVTSALSNITTEDLPERGRFLPKLYDINVLSEVFQQIAAR
jgi:hypothetical protein